MFQPNLLKGKRVLITGGGTGLGKAMGMRMIELGAELMICGRRTQVLEDTAKEFEDLFSCKVRTYVVDIRSPEAVEGLLDAAFTGGPLNVLVNNAAGNFIARTETLSHRAMDSILNIVLHGTAYCTLAAGKRWIAQGVGGVVLNIVVSYAWTGSPYVVPSAMAKAGVLALTRSLAVEWGPKGIRTVAISPGTFPTKGAWDRLVPPSMAERFESASPIGRVGEHGELADLAAYLVSDRAAYINGDCVTIDGGRWLRGAGLFSFLSDLNESDWQAMRVSRS
ncbi:MAG: SDR family oxidoreductase [Xanthobacteraceae bacterium]|jgi:NAD(P)-dependent dehydrogenase (short-subunit alcohol dehydrogenase family)